MTKIISIVVIGIVSSIALGETMPTFDSSNIRYLYRDDVKVGSVKIARVVDATSDWSCSVPCFQISLRFSISHPQTNYRFVGLAQNGAVDKTGRSYDYVVMSAQLNVGAYMSVYTEDVEIALPNAVIPSINQGTEITLNGIKYRIFEGDKNQLELKQL